MGFLKSLKDTITAAMPPAPPAAPQAREHIPVPPPPPVEEQDEEATASGSPLSARLTSLIDAAVADGEITDMERGVLVRNAQKEGVDMDEFVMVLEARLYEKRQALIALREENARPAAARRAKTPPPPPDPVRQVAQKCPACGAYIDPTTTRCPECRINYSALTGCGTAVERLERVMREIERERRTDTSFFQSFLNNQLALIGGDVITNRKCSAVAHFPIPTNKQDIFDLFASCAAKSRHHPTQYTGEEYQLCHAYKKKSREILIKARIVMADEPEILARLEAVAKQNKIKA